MANRIRDVVVINHRLDPHETELRIVVELEELTPTTEIKGRLMGPSCLGRSTIEIAHPMFAVERGVELSVIVPEPSWWSPQAPFLYQGPLELWQDGELRDRVQICHGIRSLRLTPLGLRLNGQPLVLRGKAIEPTCTQAEMLILRTQGFNTVVSGLEDSDGIDLWSRADRCGMFVLGYTDRSPEVFVLWKNELEKHPSNFAWAFCLGEWMANPTLEKPSATYYGVSTADIIFPPNASFVLTNARELNADRETAIPKILATTHIPNPLPSRQDVIGWIEYTQ